MMELNLEKLEEIHQVLLISQNDIDGVLNIIELDGNIEPTPKKRQEVNYVFEEISSKLLEVAHISSFLRNCDVFDIDQLNSEQKELLIKCESLSQSFLTSSREVLKHLTEIKQEFDEASCPVNDYEGSVNSENQEVASDKRVAPSLVEKYQRKREILKEIHSEYMFLDPKDMTEISGRRLELSEGNKLMLETEQEMSVFMDYCFFQYHKNGKNILQRYYETHSSLYTGEKLEALIALKNTRFSLLKISHAVDEHGLIVHDFLIDEDLLMIDKGIHQLAKKYENYAILTHYLRFPEFIMTTGASTPILLNNEVGREMQRIFNKLCLHHRKQQLLDNKDYRQCITDLYKIAIHSNVVKTVASRALPMNYYKATN